MNNIRSTLSWGSLIVGLSLVSALCRADASSERTAHDATPAGAYSAAALYDLGNSYARDGKPALAVLNYERARLLAPTDPDIRANLRHVLEAASLPPAPSGFEDHLRFMSPNSAYGLGLTGLIVAGVSGLLLVLKKFPRVFPGAAMTAGLLMVAYALNDAAATAHFVREAVVMRSASASATPIANAEALFVLPPAARVQIQDEHGNFLLVRDSRGNVGGNVGWVPRDQVIRVIDSTGDVHA